MIGQRINIFYLKGLHKKLLLKDGLGTNTIQTSNNLFIGGMSNLNNLMRGKLDDVRIYNRELTQDDINLLYNGGTGTEVDTNSAVNSLSGFTLSGSNIN